MSWVEIKKAVNSNLEESLDKLIKRVVNTSTVPLNKQVGDLTSWLMRLETSILATKTDTNTIISRGMVKKVQRGVAGSVGSSSRYITISSVNLAKSILIVNGNEYKLNTGSIRNGTIYFASATSIAQTSQSVNSPYVCSDFAWQVIEFY